MGLELATINKPISLSEVHRREFVLASVDSVLEVHFLSKTNLSGVVRHKTTPPGFLLTPRSGTISVYDHVRLILPAVKPLVIGNGDVHRFVPNLEREVTSSEELPICFLGETPAFFSKPSQQNGPNH